MLHFVSTLNEKKELGAPRVDLEGFLIGIPCENRASKGVFSNKQPDDIKSPTNKREE